MNEQPAGPYRLTRIEEIAPVISDEDFTGGQEGILSVMPASQVDLSPVRCWISRTDGHASLAMDEVPPHVIDIQRPIGMPDQGSGFLNRIAHPAMTISNLHDAVCIPGGIVLRDHSVLANSFSASWETYQHRHMSSIDGQWHLRPDRLSSTKDIPHIDSPVLYLDHQHIDWFGHVIADLLSPA